MRGYTLDEATPQRPKRPWILIAGLVAGVVVLAVGIAAFALTRDDDGPQRSATEQIAVARQACQQWLDSDTAPSGPGLGAGWCDDMAGWMSGHMGNGQMSMGGRDVGEPRRHARRLHTSHGQHPNRRRQRHPVVRPDGRLDDPTRRWLGRLARQLGRLINIRSSRSTGRARPSERTVVRRPPADAAACSSWPRASMRSSLMACSFGCEAPTSGRNVDGGSNGGSNRLCSGDASTQGCWRRAGGAGASRHCGRRGRLCRGRARVGQRHAFSHAQGWCRTLRESTPQ
jgi:hypothetical protein